ncbi:hypothetical protein SAY87_003961 [Trapa incisa]|uniref:DFDF domain-containing protein n=1 Tax=Trapa incisa TaxID=236973 RepID=A0AAN7JNB6_9MYRT|nr:hypothetical protein SAY87_003961 [Trapa incisa]
MPSPTTSFVSPLTPMDLERSSSMPIATDKPNFTVCSIFQTFLSADGVSTSCNTEGLKLSSVVTGLRSPTEPANCPSPQSLEIILDDVDAIKVLTSESHSISSKGDKAPDLLVRAAPSRKIDGNSTHAHQISKGSSKQIVVKKDGTDVISWENLRGRSMERGKKITHSTELMEDFDFEAMNRKFKKDEIWGDLGKLRNQLKGKGNAGKNDAAKSDLAVAVMSLDIKPVKPATDVCAMFPKREREMERKGAESEPTGHLALSLFLVDVLSTGSSGSLIPDLKLLEKILSCLRLICIGVIGFSKSRFKGEGNRHH